MKNRDSYVDPQRRPTAGRITVAAYPPQRNGVPVEYVRVTEMQKHCLICKHFTAPRDLRQQRRYVVQIDVGCCRLRRQLETCEKFEKIEELRGRNMDIIEKIHAHHYTRKFLRRVVRFYFRNPAMRYRSDMWSPRELSDLIAAYQNMQKRKKDSADGTLPREE